MVSMTMVQKLRRMNLKRLVEQMFEGNASEAGRKLATSHTYMWQILSGHRGIGERSARDIETKLKLQPYDLDKRHGGTTPPANLIKVPVRSLAAIDAKADDYRVCPVSGYVDVFAVVADADTETTMAEFREGDVVFIEPCAKVEHAKKLYLVRYQREYARLLQARADGDGGFEFWTTMKPKRIDEPFKVIGRVIASTRHFT